MSEQKQELFKKLYKNVTPYRYKCHCVDSHDWNEDTEKGEVNQHDWMTAPETTVTDSPSTKSGATPTYDVDDEEGVFSGLRTVEASVKSDEPLIGDSVSSKSSGTAGNQRIPEEYKKKCDPSISFGDIRAALTYFSSSSDPILPGDEKLLKFGYKFIKNVTERGGEQIWSNAKLAMYGKNVTVILKSGDETNKFEIALDEKDNPIDHCPERGLRLQFWDGLPMSS
uniref:Uncharacterized protein LOC102810409 n=1 Tax=Saccoglossus kowalevskii TaxID=10224 RepID=A0ABM0MVX9_SACKO|nr:PREDICTED: uncharacterized protein LOC102810409 [Saccoglossus kowalevskii]